MKGFPNQISNLRKLTDSINVIAELQAAGANPHEDRVLGEALLRSSILKTGHKPRPIDEYLEEQRKKEPSYRSYETAARGTRELFKILGFIEQRGDDVVVTPLGSQIASFAGQELMPEHVNIWRTSIRNIEHDGGDGETSHPYQILLRFLALRPGLTRAKCALALEATNDTHEELSRIVELSDQDESDIRKSINVTKTNWDNAKKILPSFAEQLEDVQKIGGKMYLSDAPGVSIEEPRQEPDKPTRAQAPVRRPRSSREVTSSTIARAGQSDSFDEVQLPVPETIDPTQLAQTIQMRKRRLMRHNAIVGLVASSLENRAIGLLEFPFDCLACFSDTGVLVEVKTLDGTPRDERERVRDALSQLLYYESFVTPPVLEKKTILKVACFESKPSDDHIQWLHKSDILVIWLVSGQFDADAASKAALSEYLDFST